MIEFRGISKNFGGAVALSDVSFTIPPGEVHGLMGENGAGKSTLGKTLAGIHQPSTGSIQLDGRTIHLRSPKDARAAGIGMVHQELATCSELTVAENLSLGNYPSRWGFLDRGQMRQRACEMLADIAPDLDVDRPLRSLSTAQEQLVQIAAAVGLGAHVLIFDEPTSSLSEPEARRLFELIATLRKRGVTMVYVSHRMPEVLALCDRISVLRDGKYMGTLTRAQADEPTLVKMMVGRAVDALAHRPAAPRSTGAALVVEGLNSRGRFESISFSVAAGEIVGLAGLVGAGRSEVAQAIFGLDRSASGRVCVLGKWLQAGRRGGVADALEAGLLFCPEDRKRQGLVLQMSCRENLTLANLPGVSSHGWLLGGRERELSAGQIARMNIKTAGDHVAVSTLSGGNQQKIALGKWLARGCRDGAGGQVLIVDEPTRGVDIAAKAAIHQLLIELAADGMAILLISSELPELLTLSTRILVMRQGRLVGELPAGSTEEQVLMHMAGGSSATGEVA